MKDNQSVEREVTAETAEAEVKEAATELGKFKDVKALMEAYTALEAEFTRRSQRLKELEANKEQSSPAEAASAEAPSQAEMPSAAESDKLPDEVKKAVIEEYLNGVCAHRGVPFVTGGGAVATVRRVPSNLQEAGTLAKKYLQNKEK